MILLTRVPQVDTKCESTHDDAPLLQLLEDRSDLEGEGERELAASLLRVRGRDDAHVRFVRLAVMMPDQVLQVARQQDGLPAQRLHAGRTKHLAK